MLASNILRFVVFLFFPFNELNATDQSQLTSNDFCSRHPKSCLAGETPTLPLLTLQQKQTTDVELYVNSPDFVSDDPTKMLPALRKLLNAEPELFATIYLPHDAKGVCLPCRMWKDAVFEWQENNPELILKLVLVGSL